MSSTLLRVPVLSRRAWWLINAALGVGLCALGWPASGVLVLLVGLIVRLLRDLRALALMSGEC